MSFKLSLICAVTLFATGFNCQEAPATESTSAPTTTAATSVQTNAPNATSSESSGCQNRTRRIEPDYYEDYYDYKDYYFLEEDDDDDDDYNRVQKRSVEDSDGEVIMRAETRRRTPTRNKLAETGESGSETSTDAPTTAKVTKKSSATKKASKKEKNKKKKSQLRGITSSTRGGHKGHKHIKPIGECLPEKSGWCLPINRTLDEGVAQCDSKLDYCVDDCDCPGYQKCCYNSCGRTECLPSVTTVPTPAPSSQEPTSEKAESNEPTMTDEPFLF